MDKAINPKLRKRYMEIISKLHAALIVQNCVWYNEESVLVTKTDLIYEKNKRGAILISGHIGENFAPTLLTWSGAKNEQEFHAAAEWAAENGKYAHERTAFRLELHYNKAGIIFPD